MLQNFYWDQWGLCLLCVTSKWQQTLSSVEKPAFYGTDSASCCSDPSLDPRSFSLWHKFILNEDFFLNKRFDKTPLHAYTDPWQNCSCSTFQSGKTLIPVTFLQSILDDMPSWDIFLISLELMGQLESYLCLTVQPITIIWKSCSK